MKMRHNQPGTIVSQVQTYHRSGPLPPPEELERYGQLMPGLIERIVSTAEKEQEHRFYVQKEELNQNTLALEITQRDGVRADYIVKTENRNSLIGLISAFFSLFFCITGSVICAYLNHPWTSSIIGGIALIVSSFVYGSRLRYNNSNHKTHPPAK